MNSIQAVRIGVRLFTGPFISMCNCQYMQADIVRGGFALEMPLSND